MSNWDNMQQWEVVLPPSRPTVTELERIEKMISVFNRTEPVAVLGSTPEFRELLGRMSFKNVFVFDKSEDFNRLMTQLIPAPEKLSETLILGDWLNTLGLYKEKFNFILSDLTMGNISYENRKTFYNSIYESLKIDGLFIDKVLAFDFSIPSIDALFEKYENLPVNLRTINDFSSEVLFCSELVSEKQIVDSTKFYQLIRLGRYSEKIKHFADKAHMITPEGFTWYYGIPWEQLEKEYFGNYSQITIYPEEDASSPYYQRTKQIFNKK